MSTFGIVLAGGASSRMGSNKAGLPWQGQPMVERQFSLLEKTGLDDIIVAGSWPDLPCIYDEVTYAGPLAALYSIFRKLPLLTRVMVVPVDMPLLETSHLMPLMANPAALVGYEGHPLPFCATMTPALLHGISAKLKLNQGALQGLWDVVPDNLWLKSEDKTFLANANRPEEWQALQPSAGVP